EDEAEPPGAWRQVPGERDAATLRRLIHRRHASQGLAAVVRDRRLGDRELDRVQDDLVGRLGDGDGDGLLTTEAERPQVGLEPEVVTARHHMRRQPIWVHGVLSGEQSDSDEPLLYPNYRASLRGLGAGAQSPRAQADGRPAIHRDRPSANAATGDRLP